VSQNKTLLAISTNANSTNTSTGHEVQQGE